MPPTKVVHFIYFLVLDANCNQLTYFFADSTISRYKNLLIDCVKRFIMQRPIIFWGEGVIVKADERFLSRRGIIRIPIRTDDDIKYTI